MPPKKAVKGRTDKGNKGGGNNRKDNKDRNVSEHSIEGHSVQIVRGPGLEELWIDGQRRRFFTNSGGYVLRDNAYVPAEPDLLDAVRRHLDQAELDVPGKAGGEG